MPRDVTILAAGGTIAMTSATAGGGAPTGSRRHSADERAGAVPALSAQDLVAAVPGLAATPGLEARTAGGAPGARMTTADALAIAREAGALAGAGRGVVVTHGTDTLEETAALTAWLHDADAPVVFTGAIRPASTPGADGPANLSDAVAAAGSDECSGVGVLVCFGGELHGALDARKVDATSPLAFGSPRGGPLGWVAEGRVHLSRRPAALAKALDLGEIGARVPIVATWLGDDGSLFRAAAGQADGLVLVALGAGHVPPPVLTALREATARIPVVVTVRPERGSLLRCTYGFEGSEADVRATGAVCAAALSPQAARMSLLACLASGLRGEALAAALAPFDA